MQGAYTLGLFLTLSLARGAAFGQDAAVPATPTSPPGWINVRDLGAVGDGKTDDTEALQRAIDSAWITGDFNPRFVNPRFGPGKSSDGTQDRYWSGVVYIPTGVYATSKPLRLHGYCTIVGDTRQPIIQSSAKAAMVSWEGEWDEQEVDWKGSGKWAEGSDSQHAATGDKWCCNVVLRNLELRGQDYGYHTLQVHTSHLHIENCKMVGGKAGFVSTGFVMGSRIEHSAFTPALWFIQEDGRCSPRFNTSVIRDCEIMATEESRKAGEWGLVLKGWIQCISIENLLFEWTLKGILLDASQYGVTISLNNIWSYDSHGPTELIRVEAAQGLSITNVMGLNDPATITLVKGKVEQVYLQNILAKEIDAGGVKIVAMSCAPIKNPGTGSMIDGQRASATVVPD